VSKPSGLTALQILPQIFSSNSSVNKSKLLQMRTK